MTVRPDVYRVALMSGTRLLISQRLPSVARCVAQQLHITIVRNTAHPEVVATVDMPRSSFAVHHHGHLIPIDQAPTWATELLSQLTTIQPTIRTEHP